MRKIKRILLINPVSGKKGYATAFHKSFLPMSLGALAGMTPKDVEIILIDENFDYFEDKIKEAGEIDLAGITSFTSTVTRAYEIALLLKARNIPVVMGGIHVSFLPDEALQYCDSVVVGESEGTWQELLADAENGELKKIYRQEKKPDDIEIRETRLDIFSKKYLMGAVQTSRGCPMNCDFCSVTIYNGFKYRQRPVEDVIKELKRVRQKYIYFCDDNIVGRTKEQKDHAVTLFKRIVAEKINKYWFCQCSINVGEDDEVLYWMSKAGCRIICVGFESVDRENLKKMSKGQNIKLLERYPELIKRIHKNGISVLGSFMIGYPFDGYNTVKIIPEFINNVKIDAFTLSHMTPFPGTVLYKRMMDAGNITEKNYPADWKKYNFANIVYRHEKLAREDLAKVMRDIRNILTVPLGRIVRSFFITWFNTGKLTAAMAAFHWNYTSRAAYINGLKNRCRENTEPGMNGHARIK